MARQVYEPFTIPELWESYQANLNLGATPEPYIHKDDLILIHSKEVLSDGDHECQNNKIFNYASCICKVVDIKMHDKELYEYFIDDGEELVSVFDSDIDKVFRRIPQ